MSDYVVGISLTTFKCVCSFNILTAETLADFKPLIILTNFEPTFTFQRHVVLKPVKRYDVIDRLRPVISLTVKVLRTILEVIQRARQLLEDRANLRIFRQAFILVLQEFDFVLIHRAENAVFISIHINRHSSRLSISRARSILVSVILDQTFDKATVLLCLTVTHHILTLVQLFYETFTPTSSRVFDTGEFDLGRIVQRYVQQILDGTTFPFVHTNKHAVKAGKCLPLI